MRSIVRWALLIGIVAASTGASTEGVDQARRWQQEGDVARAGKQWHIAYAAYGKMAQTFPGTPHGRAAAKKARAVQKKMKAPARSPASEDPLLWMEEFVDFLVWP